jgi:hypothetical protein
VTLSSTNRAAIAIAVILLIGAAALGIYFYHQRQPLPPIPGTAAQKPPDLLSLLPADAPAVGFVDVAALRSLQNSPLAAVLGLTSPGPQADHDYAEFVRQTGFDYTRDLDKAAIAFWPQSLAVAPGAGIGDNRTLAIAEGRFDQQKIAAYALRTGKIDSTATPAVYEVPGNPTLWFEFLSSTRIVLASGKDARALLTQISNPSAPDSAMKARIQRVAGAPIFAVARTDKLPENFYANFANSPQLEKMVRSVRSLSLAAKPDGDLIKAGLDAECDSPKSAAEISTLLDGFRMVASMALYDPKTLHQMTKEQAAFLKAFIRQLKVTREDRSVRLRLDITSPMLGARPTTPLAH